MIVAWIPCEKKKVHGFSMSYSDCALVILNHWCFERWEAFVIFYSISCMEFVHFLANAHSDILMGI